MLQTFSWLVTSVDSSTQSKFIMFCFSSHVRHIFNDFPLKKAMKFLLWLTLGFPGLGSQGPFESSIIQMASKKTSFPSPPPRCFGWDGWNEDVFLWQKSWGPMLLWSQLPWLGLWSWRSGTLQILWTKKWIFGLSGQGLGGVGIEVVRVQCYQIFLDKIRWCRRFEVRLMISPGPKKESELIEPHCFFEGSVHMENPFQKIRNDFDAGCWMSWLHPDLPKSIDSEVPRLIIVWDRKRSQSQREKRRTPRRQSKWLK